MHATTSLPVRSTPQGNGYNATAAHEFAALATVLHCIADDALACLALLKKRLSAHDRRHGRRFVHTAVAYLRTDLRAAKDATRAVTHVAQQLTALDARSEWATDAARDVMGRMAKAMDSLQATARQFDADGRHRDTDCLRAVVSEELPWADDAVEQLVKTTVREHFNISALSHQITIAHKSLSSSTASVERVKLVVQDVQAKLDGDGHRAKHKWHARRS